MSFGAFWLSYAITLQPSYSAYTAYAPSNSTSSAAGLATKGFNASFGKLRMLFGGAKHIEISNRKHRFSLAIHGSTLPGFSYLLASNEYRLRGGLYYSSCSVWSSYWRALSTCGW
jgi:hypothetical protein